MSFEHMTEQLKAISMSFFERLHNPCPTCQYSWLCQTNPVAYLQAFYGRRFVLDGHALQHGYYSPRAVCQINRMLSQPHTGLFVHEVKFSEDMMHARYNNVVSRVPWSGPAAALATSTVKCRVSLPDFQPSVVDNYVPVQDAIKYVLDGKVLVTYCGPMLKRGHFYLLDVLDSVAVCPPQPPFKGSSVEDGVWEVDFTTPTLVPVWQGPQEDK